MEMNNDPYAPPEFRHLFDGRTYFPASVTHITSNPFHVSSNDEGMICESMNNTRWPRQETLTLLEIRSRLDDKFKEANQKGPLWDEVSRIMAEEHGYHRSGKKCREKFDNLYKYYKKTKEGKARRQDGKHYRFFRQLEALCGGNCQQSSQNKYEGNYSHFQMTNPGSSKINQGVKPQDLCENLMFLNSSEYDSSSSSDDNGMSLNVPGYTDTESIEMNKETQYPTTGKGGWKSKIREFIDSKMKSFMETQEVWLEKMLTTLEHKEKERMIREEEWRKKETERLEREYELRANEKAWIEARDVALMEALQKISNRTVKRLSSQRVTSTDFQDRSDIPREILDEKLNEHLIFNGWSESEISCLIKLRCNMELRMQDELHSKDEMWEKISVEMSRMGYNHNGKRCKDTWENISKYLRNDESNEEPAQTGRTVSYFQPHSPIYRRGNDADVKESRSKANLFPISHVGMAPNDNSYHRLLLSQGQNPWENYSKKINKENNCE